jgi:hypothetical protein
VINVNKVNRTVNERYSKITLITGRRYVYDNPKLPENRFFRNAIYCSNNDLSRLNDLLICSASCGLKSGDRNFCEGLPGANLTKKNTKVITRNITIREEIILLITAFVINLFIWLLV